MLADYINNKPTIETDHLILRPMKEVDVPALKKWLPDESIYTCWGKGQTRQNRIRSFCLRSQIDQQRVFIWALLKKKTMK